MHNGSGQKAVDVLIRIALILFFSAIGWTLLASLIENRLASDIHGRPLAQRPRPNAADAVSQRAGGGH
ncbi:Potassium efflux system KefA protein / Small-conductance mechanosensitive channel [Klebsiella michiganensis]|uniref:Potassium efflux system KefA protein / Small-conductance mechanosensitive channel n=1 Tax=Klebsiella michiganensis TaxID=1134687 RepID=A0A7H4N3C3_9ENTR|nr:Potassium efflux system KefA protein / Small-conductance mechanosensitive channel [Klebsiella michiganensis]